MNGPLSHSTCTSPQRELRLGACLGRGGLSQVWSATTPTGTPVAVKVSNPQVVDPAVSRALIRREYALLHALSHRHIVSVLGLMEVGESETGPELGLVMEYVGGGDLVSLTGAPPGRWAPVAARVADAVRYLHGEGLVHGDIKARNVLLRPGDEPCLIDFSLAAPIGDRGLRSGGTAAYQSANQRRGGPRRVGDDVHAFAVLVYELWTGSLPFGRNPTLGALERPGECFEMPESRRSGRLDPLAELVASTLGAPKKGLDGGIEPFCDALELAVRD